MKRNDKTIQKTSGRRVLPTVLTALAVLLAAAVVVMGVLHFLPDEDEDILQARSAVARRGVITSSIHAGGTLTDAESTGTDIPQGVELEFVVDDGDAVSQGDLIAVVDKTSVMLTIDTLQTRMEALDEKIRTAMDENVSASVTAAVAGRVKEIYAAEGQDVTEAMYENGAILLLSLDGYMAVEVEWPGVTVGTSALITLSNGDTYSGRVASIAGTSAVVIFSDYGPEKGDTASVTDSDGNRLGEGEVYIHSELAVTGYYGYVENILVSEEDLVELGDELLTLSDATDTASYAGLLAERAIMEQQMQLLFTLHETGGIYAGMDGYIVETDTGESTSAQNQNQSGFPGFMGMADYDVTYTVTLLGAESGDTGNNPEPAPEPTAEPTPEPTAEPTPEPTPETTPEPTPDTTETPAPTTDPQPTEQPSGEIPSQPTATPDAPEENPDTDTTPVPAETPANPFPTDGTEVTPTPEPTPESTPKPVVPGSPTYDGGYTFALAEVTAVSGSAFGGSGYTLTLTIYDPQTENTGTGDASGEAGSDTESNTGSDAGSASGEAGTASSFITSADDYDDADALKALLAQKSYSAAYTVASDALVYTYNSNTGLHAKETASALKTGDLLVFVFEDEAMTELLFIVRHPAEESAGTDSDTSASGEMSTTTGSFPTTGTMSAAMTQTQVSASALEEFQAFAITPDTDMTVSLLIDEMDIGRITPGMEITLTLDAVTGKTYTATVTDIGGTDANSEGSGGAKYAVEVTLPRTRDMRSGMNAAATVVIGSAKADVTVPVAALCEEGAKTVVYTGFDEETGELLTPVEVTCGLSDGFTVEILSGLNEGDTVYYFYEEEYAMEFDL